MTRWLRVFVLAAIMLAIVYGAGLLLLYAGLLDGEWFPLFVLAGLCLAIPIAYRVGYWTISS